jgi:hypothetical protein
MYRIENEDFNFQLDETTINNKQVINNLNSYYNNGLFSNLPDNIIDIALSFNNDLVGDISEYEKRYKTVRNEFNSIIYSNVLYHFCTRGIHNTLDETDRGCFYGFLIQRLKPCLPDDDEDDNSEPNEVYDRVMECLIDGNTSREDLQCLFLNFDKTISELLLVFYNSIIDYFDFDMKYYQNHTILQTRARAGQVSGLPSQACIFIYNYPTIRDDVPCAFYYSAENSESDYDADDDDDWIISDRTKFWIKYNRECMLNGTFRETYGFIVLTM